MLLLASVFKLYVLGALVEAVSVGAITRDDPVTIRHELDSLGGPTASATVVAVDRLGRQLGSKTTTATTTADHLAIIRWVDQFGDDRCWPVEDCRHLSRRLERDLLAAGERIVRVPPKLMAHSRDSARTYGKSDPIDALAVARAALREPNLPTAHLDNESRELRLLVDHREDLLAERTSHINRLRWHLHDLDPTWHQTCAPSPR